MKKLVLLAPIAALVLAGCAQDPTVAAKVAGRTIPVSDVSIVASYLCASVPSGQQIVPMTQVNEVATTYLAGAKALEDLAARQHITVPAVNSDQADPLIATLPSGQRARATQLLKEVSAATNFFAQRGVPNQQILSELASLISAETKAGRFLNNPAYPTLLGDVSGSLSKAVSSAATTAASGQPPAAYKAALPTGQKCG